MLNSIAVLISIKHLDKEKLQKYFYLPFKTIILKLHNQECKKWLFYLEFHQFVSDKTGAMLYQYVVVSTY